MNRRAVPDHLVPLEVEREFLSGIFRAADVAEEQPTHVGACAALVVAEQTSASDFVYREHRQIMAAIQWALRSEGSAHPRIVRDELRRRGEWDALRLLPSVIGYGVAPVASIGYHAEQIRDAAAGRRAWLASVETQAALLEGRDL